MTTRLSSTIRLVSDRLGYWKLRHAERRERRAERKGEQYIHVMERLRQLQEKSERAQR